MSELEVSVEDGVATLTLNRPEARNAVSTGMRVLLRDALLDVEEDAGVRCVVLRGAGDHFAAGGDVKTMAEALERDPAQLKRYFRMRLQDLEIIVLAMRRMPKPVVASVAGAAAGAGVSLALAADLVIAAEDAFFALAHVHIGATPDGAATFQLPRTIGIKRAMEMALLGERIEAPRAAELGLVNFVVPGAALEAETAKLAARLARGPTAVYGRAKALLYRSIETPIASQLEAEADSFADCATRAEFREGVSAFVAGRRPKFTGT